MSEIPPEAIHAIQSIKFVKKESTRRDEGGDEIETIDEHLEVKMNPKLKALEMRAKIQKLMRGWWMVLQKR